MLTSHTKYTGANVQISWSTCWSIQLYFIKPLYGDDDLVEKAKTHKGLAASGRRR